MSKSEERRGEGEELSSHCRGVLGGSAVEMGKLAVFDRLRSGVGSVDEWGVAASRSRSAESKVESESSFVILGTEEDVGR